MASRATLIGAGVCVAAGLGLALAAPDRSRSTTGLSPSAIAAELDGTLRAMEAALKVRAETFASLQTIQTIVGTDKDTVAKQHLDEIMVSPKPGEVVTIGQVSRGGAPVVLRALPDGQKPTSRLDGEGGRAEIVDGVLRLTDVENVAVKYADAERPGLRGLLAVSWPVDEKELLGKLDAAHTSARIEIDEKSVVLGSTPLDPTHLSTPLSLTGAGDGIRIVTAVPPAGSGVPLRPIGWGLFGLGAILSAVGLRRPKDLSLGNADTLSSASSAQSEIRVGSIIENTYEVTALLGQGGMGAVWQANHMRLPDRRVAIKLLLTGMAAHPELLARFRREAEVTSKLGHPNIVGVLDFNTLPSGAPYIVLEYLDGESLASRILRGPIPLAETLVVVRQIASALHAAHRANIVHRDLKPDNVFLVPTEQGELVKVLDFGISKMRGNVSVQTQESTVLGTPQYMSPEQANGKNSEVDARSDVWALGAITYEMLTGEPAFKGETITELLVNVLVTPSPSLLGRATIPDHVARALERALAKDPVHRYQDMPSFVEALGAQPLHSQAMGVVPES